MRRALPAILLLAALAPLSRLNAQHFTPGNLAVLLVADGTSKSTTGSIVELTTTATSAQSPVTNPGVSGLFFSGSATSTAYLANSNDGTLLCVTGPTASASNVNTVTSRGVVTLDVNQTNNLAAAYTGISGNQSRCATTIDNTNYFIADQGGFYTNGATSPGNTSNYREIKSFGGIVYASASSLVNIVTTSTGALTALPGVGTISNLTGFYLVQSGANGTTYDLLYAVTAGSETAGTIAKYSYDPASTSWTANGAYTTTFGGYSIAAKTVTGGGSAELYVSSGEGDLTANSVVKCIDAGGWNQAIDITATPITLYTATGKNSVKGIAFAPVGTVTATPPTVSLSVSTNTASEGAQTVVTVTATTSAAVTTAQTVTLQVTGEDNITSDYTLSSNTITIPAGQTTGTATFTVVDDHVTEGLEQDIIAISAVSSGLTLGSPSSQPVNIQDNDPSPTLMRITEYMYSGTYGEFIEFTNVGSTPIDMTNWSYDDNNHTPGKVNLGTYGTVQPGESVILTETDATTFRTDWNLCPGQKVIGGNTTNISSADQINLYDNNGNLVDRITYGAAGTIKTKDVSGVVSAAALGIDSIAGWVLSAVGDGQQTVQSNNIANAGVDIGSPGFSIQRTVSYSPCAVVANAPTIAIDSVNTDISLIGPGKPSPTSPYAISGTLNDPTDPAATKGLYFTVQSTDPNTPTGSIQVSVSTSNAAVVPQSGLSLTGGVASYLLKITPVDTGYSNIILTATNPDGSITTNYTILYAASHSASSSLVWHTGSSDASDGIALSDNYMAIADDQINKIFVYSRSNPGLPDTTYDYTANNALNLPDGTKQLDVEAATPSPTVTGLNYFFGSMSNSSSSFGPEPNRDRLFGVKITGSVEAKNLAFSNAGYAYIRSQLIAWGDANNYDFTDASASGQNPKAINGFNLEGAVFAPDNTTLYLGLRAPLVPVSNRTNAVIAPLLNFETWFQSGGAATATFGNPIELDLGGRGIRDMARLSNGTYIIAAGSYDGTLNPAIYTWTGNAADPAVPQPGFDVTGLNVEGLLGVDNTSGTLSLNQIQTITDNGSDVLYTDNTANKDLTEFNWQKFSTSVVTSIGTPLPVVFIAFTAQRQGTNADLDWSTGIPASLTSFSVQRSTDGATFTPIATVTAIDGQAGYSYVDQNAPTAKVYYRIQANERSGQSVLSTIRALDAGNGAASIQVYPNPVVNGTFTLIIPNAGLKTVSIYNSTGALIEQTAFGDTAKDFSTAGWAKGFYLLRILLPDGTTTTTKLIIP